MTAKHVVAGLVLAGVVVCVALPTRGQDQSTRVRIERLEQQVRDLQAEVRRLRTTLEAVRLRVVGSSNNGGTTGIPVEQPRDAMGTDGVSFFGVHSWLVRVDTNTQALAARQEATIQAAKNKLAEVTKKLAQARRQAEIMSQQQPVWDPFLGEQVNTNVHSQAEIDEANAAVRRLEREQKSARNKATQVEREAGDAPGRRRITGQTADGRTVKLTATGDAERLIGQMEPGMWYRVTGSGREIEGVLTIDIKTVVRPQDTP